MSALVIWMDTVEAKLFEIEKDSINVEKVLFQGPSHHAETLGRNHEKNQTDEEIFYRQLMKVLKGKKAKKILLMGPSLGATHFISFLEKHSPETFSRIIGAEKVDKMPDSEILSVGRKYLQRYYLYHAG